MILIKAHYTISAKTLNKVLESLANTLDLETIKVKEQLQAEIKRQNNLTGNPGFSCCQGD